MMEFISNEPIIFGIIVLGVIYLVAQIFSRKTDCIIMWDKYDVFFMIWLTWGNIFIGIFLAVINGSYSIPRPVFLSIFGIPALAMIITSIIANRGHGPISIIYIIVSVLAKLSLVFVFIIVMVILNQSSPTVKKDGRFRDGTKNNEWTRKSAWILPIVFAIITPLFLDLVKDRDGNVVGDELSIKENLTQLFFARRK